MIMKKFMIIALIFILLLCGCSQNVPQETTLPEPTVCAVHADANDDGICDRCQISVIVSFDIYAINDLHGKIADGENHPGVDELSTYLEKARDRKDNVILLSTGDMWQGSSESNMTKGLLTTEWMNEMDFAAMTLGNHEFDWGEDPIRENQEIAEFPFLAINIYDRDTKTQVDYCQSSVVVDMDGIQIGIIGAIGDCYSSIAADKVEDVYFITGQELTDLVKEESQKLRGEGVDFIIYSIHDGLGESKSASTTPVTGSQLSSYYDTTLSDGYVDLVFEAHTHQRYLLQDEHAVYHLQNKGDNKGISHAEIEFNIANLTSEVVDAELVSGSKYALMEDHPIVEELLDKYEDEIEPARRVVGTNAKLRQRNELRQIIADLYFMAGSDEWGQDYDIVLGGGFISVRDPGHLEAGEVTYSMLQSLFPFDNELVLCSIKGSDLKSKFFESNNSNYFISYGQYGASVKNNIDPNATYYIVTDTYSSTYAPNNLTEIKRYHPNTYARDLLATYMGIGGLE